MLKALSQVLLIVSWSMAVACLLLPFGPVKSSLHTVTRVTVKHVWDYAPHGPLPYVSEGSANGHDM